MSIVSPIVACGAVVPFAISLATGERPSALALAGAARRARRGGARVGRGAARRTCPTASRAVALAVGRRGRARPLHLLPRARQPRGQRALDARRRARRLARRCSSLLARGRGASRCASAGAGSLPVAAVGLCDVAANALFALASRHGLLALVSVLGSLYPVMTVAARLRLPPRAADAAPDRRRRGRARRGRRAQRRVMPSLCSRMELARRASC